MQEKKKKGKEEWLKMSKSKVILKIYKIVCLLKGLSLDFIYLLIKYSFWCTDSNKVDWLFVCAVSMM